MKVSVLLAGQFGGAIIEELLKIMESRKFDSLSDFEGSPGKKVGVISDFEQAVNTMFNRKVAEKKHLEARLRAADQEGSISLKEFKKMREAVEAFEPTLNFLKTLLWFSINDRLGLPQNSNISINPNGDIVQVVERSRHPLEGLLHSIFGKEEGATVN